MLAGLNPEKRKLTELSQESSQIEEEKQDATTLKREVDQLKANYSAALNWIQSAKYQMDKNGLLQKFNILAYH